MVSPFFLQGLPIHTYCIIKTGRSSQMPFLRPVLSCRLKSTALMLQVQHLRKGRWSWLHNAAARPLCKRQILMTLCEVLDWCLCLVSRVNLHVTNLYYSEGSGFNSRLGICYRSGSLVVDWLMDSVETLNHSVPCIWGEQANVHHLLWFCSLHIFLTCRVRAPEEPLVGQPVAMNNVLN